MNLNSYFQYENNFQHFSYALHLLLFFIHLHFQYMQDKSVCSTLSLTKTIFTLWKLFAKYSNICEWLDWISLSIFFSKFSIFFFLLSCCCLLYVSLSSILMKLLILLNEREREKQREDCIIHKANIENSWRWENLENFTSNQNVVCW